MRLAGSALLLVMAAGRTAAGECPTCARSWFEGTLQYVAWPNGTNTSPGQDRALALGDLNGDGLADMAAADGSIFVWFAHPDGIFRPGPALSPGNQSTGVAIADMDGDGALDVIAGGLTVGVTRGNGQGGFLPPSSAVAASAPIENIAVADFDGDGRPDVAAVHGQNANLVSLYRGTGGGGLAPPTTLPTTGRALCLDTGDFDRDGRPDLVVGYNLPTRVALFRNAGGGTFLPAVLYPTIPNNLDLLAADLDGDGDMDVAVAGAGVAGAQVLYGNGNGALAPGPTLAVSDLSYAIAAGDFDGDGDLDLAYDDNSDSILVSHREANGQYSSPQRLSVRAGLNALEAGDWNGDGRPDLAMGFPSGAMFLRPDIGQEIAPAATHLLGRPDRLFAADFNNDGHDDLFVNDRMNNQSSLWLGNGALGFGFSGFLMQGGVEGAADFNGDGNLDVVTLYATWLGNGNGGFTMSVPVGAFLVADFNVDGRPDVLTFTYDAINGGMTIFVRLGDGAGGFGPPISTAVAVGPFSSANLVAGRFDGDTLPDVACLCGGNRLLRGNGAGGFAAPTPIPGPAYNGSLVAGDFNRDGYSDTMNVGVGFSPDFAPATVKWGGPSGLTSGPTFTMLGSGGFQLTVGDANGDGVDDVIGAGSNLMLGDPGGNLRLLGFVTGGGGGTAIADWNGDGRPDLATGGPFANQVTFFVSTSCQARTLGLVTAPSSCHTPGSPFATQPVVVAMDGAGNVVCPAGDVTASLLPGAGTAGAILGGTAAVPLVDGTATFTNLSVDQPGRRYRLSFDHPGLVPVTSPTFSQGLAPVVTGSALACPGRPELYEVGQGYDTYDWRLDGAFQATSAAALLDVPAGLHDVEVTVRQDACSASDLLAVTSAPPSIDITVVGPTTVCTACTGGLFGANAAAAANAPLQWGYRTQPGGTITPLPGQTSATYRLAGPDFPAPGAYLVVASVECGSVAISNEIPITVAVPPPVHEIGHGQRVEGDLSPLAPAGATRQYLLAQEARSSYEVVVEATSGDIGLGQGPLVEHVAGDGLTVLGSAAPVGSGPSRSLRIVNAGASRAVDFVRVTSASCGTDCGADDVYTLRAYETTLRATRFNNFGSQTTVVLLQNSGSGTVAGEIHFWSGTGARLAGQPFVLGPRELLVLPAAGLPPLAGTGGSITISHDGPHGSLAGKTVAIEPSSGFSFDTPFTVRAR